MASHSSGFYSLVTICLVTFGVYVVNGSSRDDENISNRLTTLENEQRESKNEMKILQRTIEDQQLIIQRQEGRINKLEEEVLVHKRAVKENKVHIDQNKRALSNIRSRLLKTYKMANQNAQKSQQPDQTVRNGYGNRIQRSQTEYPKWRQSRGLQRKQVQGGIAFTAYLDHDLDIGAMQTIKFNQVTLNDGASYNVNTGVFSCLESGVYMFTFFIGERHHNELRASLMVNSVDIIDAVVEPVHTLQDLQGGNMAVVRLKQGDAVWVQSRAAYHVEGSGSFRLTSFTGIYLYS